MISKYSQKAKEDVAVASLLTILKVSDEEAYEHSKDVADLVGLCLEEMQKQNECPYTDNEIIEIVKGAFLHDIGKAFLPFGIQHSSMKMDAYSREVVKQHPVLGYITVNQSPFSDIVKNIVLLHHENANGGGYPENIVEERPYTADEIPEYVWIVAYADRFNAMTGSRKFKSSFSYAEAWDELNDLRIKEVLPYKFARYYHNVIKNLTI